MTTALSSQFMPYGAPELQRAARPHMVRALALSSLLVTAAFALAWSLSLLYTPSRIIEVPISTPTYNPEDYRIPSPPPLVRVPPVAQPRPAKPADAVPVPKPDASVPKDQTILSQGERNQKDGATSTGGGVLSIPSGTGDEATNRPGEVAFVDRFPEPIVRVTPRYSEFARQAQAEGTVVVYALVGKDGRVREVQLHPEKHQPILDPLALDAARQWTFEPALANGHPVAVWVALPFKFALR